MNAQPINYINKKYTVKSTRKEDYSETNPRSREEFAKEFVHALKDAEKFLRGEIELRSINELLKEADEYIEEEKENGRF